MGVIKSDALSMYRWMVLTRRFEEKVVALYKQRGSAEMPHSSIGQEAVGVGVCYGLRRDDWVLPSLRTRAAFLVRGISCRHQMAAVFGKDTPQAGGKNTSHHMGDPNLGLMVGGGIVGGGIAVGVGAGLACKYRNSGAVSVVFFGDGASNRGDFHEALNLAGVLKLPVVFVIENNQYAMSTPLSRSTACRRLCDRSASYGFPGAQVDGNDVLAVHEAAQEAVDRARQDSIPTLLECVTYRWRGHSERDVDTPYRTVEEVEQWKLRCPIKRLHNQLLAWGCSERELETIDESCCAEVEDAAAYMDSAPYPSPESAAAGVYVGA